MTKPYFRLLKSEQLAVRGDTAALWIMLCWTSHLIIYSHLHICAWKEQLHNEQCTKRGHTSSNRMYLYGMLLKPWWSHLKKKNLSKQETSADLLQPSVPEAYFKRLKHCPSVETMNLWCDALRKNQTKCFLYSQVKKKFSSLSKSVQSINTQWLINKQFYKWSAIEVDNSEDLQ